MMFQLEHGPCCACSYPDRKKGPKEGPLLALRSFRTLRSTKDLTHDAKYGGAALVEAAHHGQLARTLLATLMWQVAAAAA
jgi:hypothetical protein